MSNDHTPADSQPERRESPLNPDSALGGGETDRALANEPVVLTEAAQNEAEQLRRRAEDARELRDRHRDTIETIRQQRERLRETAETTRAVSEDARVAAEAARQESVDVLRATADTLNRTLAQMQVVEEMRRTLREIGDVNKLDSH